jgi:hypothetical protein
MMLDFGAPPKEVEVMCEKREAPGRLLLWPAHMTGLSEVNGSSGIVTCLHWLTTSVDSVVKASWTPMMVKVKVNRTERVAAA